MFHDINNDPKYLQDSSVNYLNLSEEFKNSTMVTFSLYIIWPEEGDIIVFFLFAIDVNTDS